MPELPPPVPGALAEYRQTEGFALPTHTTEQLLSDLGALPDPGPLDSVQSDKYIGPYEYDLLNNPAAASLYVTTRYLTEPIRNTMGDNEAIFHNRHGISPADVKKALDAAAIRGEAANGGFESLDTPWMIAAGLANSCVDEFIKAGVMTREQKDHMTLGDWANIIGSGWFAKLSGRLLYADIGKYADFGTKTSTYVKDGFDEHLRNKKILAEGETALQYAQRTEVDEDGAQYTYHVIEPTKELTRGLRRSMEESPVGNDAIGCPIGRTVVNLSPELVKKNHHVKALIRSEVLLAFPDQDPNETMKFQQAGGWTALDKTLAFFAWQLDNYQKHHGTPRYDVLGGSNVWHDPQPTGEELRDPTPQSAPDSMLAAVN